MIEFVFKPFGEMTEAMATFIDISSYLISGSWTILRFRGSCFSTQPDMNAIETITIIKYLNIYL